MKAIYVHIDFNDLPFSKEFIPNQWVFQKIPDYAQHSISQTKHFLKTEPIILSNEYINTSIKEEAINFFNACKNGFPSFFRCPFWFTSLFRLYVLYTYCKTNNIEEFIHLEYDNLIYSDLEVFKKLPKSIYFTRVGPSKSSAGFVYCNSLEHFTKFNDSLIQLVNKGINTIAQLTGYGYLSDMESVELIYRYRQNTVDYLPILPFSPGNENFDKLNVLFDGASYGQHIGGTNQKHPPGYAERGHYVGCAILDQQIEVKFDKTPFVIYNGKEIPILNLHIHSKNLDKFLVL